MPSSSLFPQPSPGGGSSAALGGVATAGGVVSVAQQQQQHQHLNAASSSLSLNSLEMELNAGINGNRTAVAATTNGGLLDELQNGSNGSSRMTQLAMELAMLQQSGAPFDSPNSSNGTHPGLTATASLGPGGVHGGANNMAMLNPDNPLLHPFGGNGVSVSAMGGVGGSLEDLKTRRSQNMTECVPVPTSEHVAEIVGRQGCKIKALRAKTNTYIKTPVRGEEPVFVVTGRKEDVTLAKREILSAAEHFSQIRASRSKNSQGINSTLAFGQMVANQPGQTTTQVRVPYRVVGLVVGPKGATIKRIQQTTHTYIVTPSRDKEPVFEVTGLPENVESARKEIEAHIAMRTGADSLANSNGSSSAGSTGGPNGIGNIYGIGEHPLNHINSSDSGGFGSNFGSNSMDHLNGSNSKYSSILNGHDGFGKSNVPSSGGLTLNSLLDNGTSHWGNVNSHNPLTGTRSGDPGLTSWSSNGGTDDIMRQQQMNRGRASPSFESNGHHVPTHAELTGTGIWGEININKMIGNLDLNGDDHSQGGPPASSALMLGLNNGSNNGNGRGGNSNNPAAFMSVGSRSSLDLGSLGRPSHHAAGGSNSLDFSSTSSTGSSSNHTATPPHQLVGGGDSSSPPASLPFGGLGAGPLHRASVSSEPAVTGFGNDDGDNKHEMDLNKITDTTEGIDSGSNMQQQQPVSSSSNACEGISAERGHDFLSFAK